MLVYYCDCWNNIVIIVPSLRCNTELGTTRQSFGKTCPAKTEKRPRHKSSVICCMLLNDRKGLLHFCRYHFKNSFEPACITICNNNAARFPNKTVRLIIIFIVLVPIGMPTYPHADYLLSLFCGLSKTFGLAQQWNNNDTRIHTRVLTRKLVIIPLPLLSPSKPLPNTHTHTHARCRCIICIQSVVVLVVYNIILLCVRYHESVGDIIIGIESLTHRPQTEII